MVISNADFLELFVDLVVSEISTAMKGHGLVDNKNRYVDSERALSRFHGVLKQREREVVFEVFRGYHDEVFERNGLLDSDDVALSLLGRLRTPIWNSNARRLGSTFIFLTRPSFSTRTNGEFPAIDAWDREACPDRARSRRGAANSRYAVCRVRGSWSRSARQREFVCGPPLHDGGNAARLVRHSTDD